MIRPEIVIWDPSKALDAAHERIRQQDAELETLRPSLRAATA